MGDGKRGVAPCGHDGEHVIGTYVRCLEGCDDVLELELDDVESSDGVPSAVDPERTKPLCAHCQSADVASYPGMYDQDGKQLWHCHDCGKGFMS